MLSHRRFYQILIIICTYSCSTVHREQPVALKPIPRDSVKLSPLEGWLPHQSAIAGEYMIEDSSTISVNNDSVQSPSINSRTVFTVMTQLVGDSAVLHATVDSLIVSSHTPVARGVFDSSSQSQTFQATLSPTGKVQKIDGRVTPICVGGQDPAASRIFDFTITYPKHRIKDGDKWADSTRITTCRGKIPVSQESTRQYQMLGRISSPTSSTVKIQRTTSTHFIGIGPSARNPLEIEGSGTSSTTLYVDDVNGLLLHADGQSTSTLNVLTTRGSYLFIQNILTDIKRR